MKIKLLIAFLLVSFFAASQPTNYQKIAARYRWIAGMFDSTLHIPAMATNSLKTGGYIGAGAIVYNTTDSNVYVWSGTNWHKSSRFYDSTLMASRYWVQQQGYDNNTFTNGLTESGGVVKLGGTLIDATTVIDGSDNDFEFDGFGEIIISGNSTAGKGYVGISGRDSIRLLADDGIKNSFFHILKNKLIAKAYLGEYYIDTLNYTLSTTGKKIMLRDTASGLVENIDPALLGGGSTTADSTIISTAAQTDFIFSSVPASYNDYIIYLNGVAIEPATYFTTSSNTITFSTGLAADDRVRFKRIK